jgi:hypothetical protein
MSFSYHPSTKHIYTFVDLIFCGLQAKQLLFVLHISSGEVAGGDAC